MSANTSSSLSGRFTGFGRYRFDGKIAVKCGGDFAHLGDGVKVVLALRVWMGARQKRDLGGRAPALPVHQLAAWRVIDHRVACFARWSARD